MLRRLGSYFGLGRNELVVSHPVRIYIFPGYYIIVISTSLFLRCVYLGSVVFFRKSVITRVSTRVLRVLVVVGGSRRHEGLRVISVQSI